MKNNKSINILLLILLLIGFLSGCTTVDTKTRDESIPDNAVKMTPETDLYPPQLHSDEWMDPIPMEGPINTAGVEDAPVISPDGNTFFFFFTPDANIPANQQLLDGVTGIWWCHKQGDSWSEPTRVLLSENVALDGPVCINENILWFASFRFGNYGEDGDVWTAINENGEWNNIENVGKLLNDDYNIGEMYLSGDKNTIYFSRDSIPGSGELDLFITTFMNNNWTEPENIGLPVSSSINDAQPFVNADETELWFTRPSSKGYVGPAVYQSIKNPDGIWREPEEIVSNFVGDVGMDTAGNLYFTHVFVDESMNKIETDIYVCYRK